MKKELIESILSIIPEGYHINFEIKGARNLDLFIRFIDFDHNAQEVTITFCDENNMGR